MRPAFEPFAIAAVGLLTIAYIIADYRKSRGLVYVLKPATLLVIILVAVWGQTAGPVYRWLVVAGLLASLVGDYFLLDSKKFFLHGLTAFLIAHLFYVAAFLQRSMIISNWWMLLFLLAAGVLIFMRLRPNLGSLKLPVIFYMAIIVVMVWRAWEGWFLQEDAPALMAALGAMLFMISDAALSIEKFVGPYAAARGLVMSTYFTGQLLIAFSV